MSLHAQDPANRPFWFNSSIWFCYVLYLLCVGEKIRLFRSNGLDHRIYDEISSVRSVHICVYICRFWWISIQRNRIGIIYINIYTLVRTLKNVPSSLFAKHVYAIIIILLCMYNIHIEPAHYLRIGCSLTTMVGSIFRKAILKERIYQYWKFYYTYMSCKYELPTQRKSI